MSYRTRRKTPAKNGLACVLGAFWPFVLAGVIGGIWGMYALTQEPDLNGDPQGWIILGQIIIFVEVVVGAAFLIGFGWVWCHDNYRKCVSQEINQSNMDEIE